ncbi:MAG: hypothetical protein ACYDAL_02085 [Candidatus Dormibacteraceae bacterium]
MTRRRLTIAEAPALMTFGQAAEVLSVGKNAVTQGVRSGHIPVVELTPTMRRIPRAGLSRLLLIEEGKAG